MGFPVLQGMTLVGQKVIRYMVSKGYKVRALNIIYLEGINTDLKTVNPDKIGGWNDVRSIITNKGEVLMSASATTEPDWYYRMNPMNDKGCAQIAFGQYLQAWELGYHYKQEALVQCGDISVYRDFNHDGSRQGDKLYTGSDFAINQHTTGNDSSAQPPDSVGRWSAGCSVGQYASTHYNVFIPICKAMGLTKFDSTYIDGEEFADFRG